MRCGELLSKMMISSWTSALNDLDLDLDLVPGLVDGDAADGVGIHGVPELSVKNILQLGHTVIGHVQ